MQPQAFSDFRFSWIPLAGSGRAGRTVMNQSRVGTNNSHVILAVDDDRAVRNSLKFMMEVEGFEVHAYSSARELLNQEGLPANSCLVTDYHMPEMTGLELVAELRERRISIPAILMTAHPNQNLRVRAAGVRTLIVEKPLLGDRLLDAICEAFDGHTKSLP
jgi:two-component system response regulator FixJ